MEKYILDTNFFFNMEEGIGLGNKTEEVIRNITRKFQISNPLREASFKFEIELYMPPRIVEELLGFFEDKEQPFLKEFLSQVTVKSPDISKINLPGNVFYQLVDDIRGRSYRGLRIGEESIGQAAKAMIGKNDLSKKDFEIAVGSVVKNFRDRYRQATRFGFIDSLADLDLIMLAKELDGFLVTTDEGVIKWGRVFGVKEMAAAVFGAKMRG